jgi:hypothetical protein
VAGLAGSWRAESAIGGRDLELEQADRRMIIGLAGRRLVGLRRGARSTTMSLARLERRCARDQPALPGDDLAACDVSRYLHWLDRLWFDGRLRPSHPTH